MNKDPAFSWRCRRNFNLAIKRAERPTNATRTWVLLFACRSRCVLCVVHGTNPFHFVVEVPRNLIPDQSRPERREVRRNAGS